MRELGSRAKQQAPPPWVVWEALVDPFRDPSRPWLDLATDEVVPTVVEAVRPSLVVWSSLWSDRPGDRIRFDLERAGSGCSLRWTLLTPADPPDEARIGHLRYRLNRLVNAQLRYSFGH